MEKFVVLITEISMKQISYVISFMYSKNLEYDVTNFIIFILHYFIDQLI